MKWRLACVLTTLLLGSTAPADEEPRLARLLVGTEEGGPGELWVHVAPSSYQGTLAPFGDGHTGAVQVAMGDVNGDGVLDFVVGSGSAALVKVFDGAAWGTELRSLTAFEGASTGGVHVACGDVDDDGLDDIVAGAGEGAEPRVTVFSGDAGLGQLASFLAYDAGFTGGVRVATGDVNGDGHADIITGMGPGAETRSVVRVFDGTDTGSVLAEFSPYPVPGAGVHVAGGDVDGDGIDDVIMAPGAGEVPAVFGYSVATGTQPMGFFAFDPNYYGGVRVCAVDLDGAGGVEIFVGTAPGVETTVEWYHALGDRMGGFRPFGAGHTGGANVAGGVGLPPPSRVAGWEFMQ